MKTGIVEGFFGPQWPDDSRKSYAAFLQKFGGDFYIYAPKQDPHLRKKWREDWNSNYVSSLQQLVETFHKSGIKFGVGFSPFGIGEVLTEEDKKILSEKLAILISIKVDILGLFFDDMPTNENLAQTQIEVLNHIKTVFTDKIIFCPSYYTPDPILDKVFGNRPAHYLEDIAMGLPLDVSIAWTGPKVISPVIDSEHLIEVAQLLKRKPLIWENIFANDGPKNCKFLKLKPFTGRDEKTIQEVEAFGFNMMNQPELSKILYLASKLTLEGMPAEKAFDKSLSMICSNPFKIFILQNQEKFLITGLDKMDETEKQQWIEELEVFNDLGAVEIRKWLQGQYNVGSECLTD